MGRRGAAEGDAPGEQVPHPGGKSLRPGEPGCPGRPACWRLAEPMGEAGKMRSGLLWGGGAAWPRGQGRGITCAHRVVMDGGWRACGQQWPLWGRERPPVRDTAGVDIQRRFVVAPCLPADGAPTTQALGGKDSLRRRPHAALTAPTGGEKEPREGRF